MRTLVGVALAGGTWLCACTSTLRSGLREADAVEIVVALDAAGIAASKTEETSGKRDAFAVEVPATDLRNALALLVARGLPKTREPGFEQLYPQAGLVSTPAEERARAQFAAAGELARTLERLPGVVEARVHLSLPDPAQALDASPQPNRAAVLLLRAPGVGAIDELAVRTLVAGAVEGLERSQIEIVQRVASPAAPARPAFARVGPFSVTRATAPWLKAALAGLLSVNAGLAGLLIVLAQRRRRARAQ